MEEGGGICSTLWAGEHPRRGRGQGATCGRLPRRAIRPGVVSFCAADGDRAVLLFAFVRPTGGYLELLTDTAASGSPQVSILFCDIVSYTHMSSEMTPDLIVDLLNTVYT